MILCTESFIYCRIFKWVTKYDNIVFVNTIVDDEHEGRSRGGQTRKDQLGHEGYQEMGQRGGQTRKDQLSHEGYQEMGRKGGLSTMEKSGAERVAEEGIDIDESKFRTRT